jgi:hypothetical protein
VEFLETNAPTVIGVIVSGVSGGGTFEESQALESDFLYIW